MWYLEENNKLVFIFIKNVIVIGNFIFFYYLRFSLNDKEMLFKYMLSDEDWKTDYSSFLYGLHFVKNNFDMAFVSSKLMLKNGQYL